MSKAATQKYHKGIIHFSPEMVREAIREGADVNAPDEFRSGHPFEDLMCEHSYLFNGAQSKYDMDQRLKLLEIADIILDAGPRLTFGQASVLPHIISRGRHAIKDPAWLDLAARAVIDSACDDIRAGAKVFVPDYDRIFRHLGTKDDPYGLRKEAMDSIEAVHNRVEQRLAQPKTENEKFLAAHKEEARFWVSPFERPDLHKLPCLSQAPVRVMRLMNALNDFEKVAPEPPPEVRFIHLPPDKRLEKGVLFQSPLLVESALADNADVNTSCASTVSHFAYLMQYSATVFSDIYHGPDRELKKINFCKIVDMFLDAGVDLTETKGHTGTCLLDRIVYCSGDRDDPVYAAVVVKTVLRALRSDIESGRPPYTPAYEGIFMGLGESSTNIRGRAMDSIQAIHEEVRTRLGAPSSKDEIFLSAHLDKIGFWASPFQRPDTDFLPKPSAQYVQAIDELTSTNESLLDAFAKKDDRALMIKSVEADQAVKKMDKAAADMKEKSDARTKNLGKKGGPGSPLN